MATRRQPGTRREAELRRKETARKRKEAEDRKARQQARQQARQRELNAKERQELQAFRDAAIERSRRASRSRIWGGQAVPPSGGTGGQGGPPPSIDFDLGADWPPQEISLDYDGGRVSSVNANIEKKYKHGGFIRRNPSTVNR